MEVQSLVARDSQMWYPTNDRTIVAQITHVWICALSVAMIKA